MAIFRRKPPPNGGVECRWGRLKSRNQRLFGLAINNCCNVVCISHFAAGFLFTAGIGRPSAISRYTHTQSRWTWIVCMTARLDVTPKTTEQNRIVRTDRSETEVTNNKKLRSRYCTIEANYWQTRSIAQLFCDSRASCFQILFSKKIITRYNRKPTCLRQPLKL